MEIIKLNKKQIEDDITTFISPFKSVVMASINFENEICLSTIPIIKINHSIYTLISKSATHFENLKVNNQKIVEIIFAQDETKMENAFLKKRVSYKVHASFIKENKLISQAFRDQHGSVIDMILTLDFVFVELKIINGKAIFGPAQVYLIDQNEKYLELID